jgi:hypothetical protein
LIIARYGIKTGVAMKTLSRRFRFVVLGVIVIVAVVSCCEYGFVVPGIIVPGTRSFAFVDIGTQQRDKWTYVEWKDKGDFDTALAQVCGHQGTYDLYVLLHDTDQHPNHPYKPCPPNPSGSIRTVKVTKSKAAYKIAAVESVANDPNVMHRIQSPDPGDISAVLKTLKPVP